MPEKFDATIRSAVADAVNKQAQAGLDIVSDGEMGKISYATYIRHRLTGFEPGNVPRATPQDQDDFPEFRDKIAAAGATPKYKRPVCKGPIKVKTLEPLQQDIARFKDALSKAKVTDGFHERGFARHHRGFSAERVLSDARSLPGSAGGGDADRIRDHRELGPDPFGGLSGSGHGPAHQVSRRG